MTLKAYLLDHRLQITAYLFGLCLFCGGLWLDPSHRVHGDTLLYMASLITLFAMAITALAYRRRKRWLSDWQARINAGADALDWPLAPAQNHEQAVITQAVNQLLQAHRQAMTQVLTTQQDYRAYLDSWVHEAKVPLAAISLIVDSLDGQVDETKLTQLSLQLDKIDHDVEQVLYYSRLDSFSRDYLLRDYDLKQVVNAVAVDQRNSFIAKQLSFQVVGPAITVTTDDKWLRFILRQLLANAIKYTPAGGAIKAILAHGEHEATLTIQDSGIGIPADEQHRVFEKGFTGTNGRNANQKSTGLGLYLAAQLAQRLGHHLTLTSTVGAGTEVTVHFTHLDYYGDSGATLTPQPLAK